MNDEKKEREPELWQTISLKKFVSPEVIELKEKNGRLRQWLIIGVIAAFTLGWFGGSVLPWRSTAGLRTVLSGGKGLDTSKIESALQTMSKEWYFGKDIENLDKRLTDQALLGITDNEEDSHTTYMSASEMESFTQSINRNYVGIGVQFQNTENLAIIDKVFKNSPAEKAGIQAGDIISTVDGKSIEGMTSDEIRELVQGDEGTIVTMTFLRGNQTMTYKIQRASVSATSFGRVLEDQIGYLEIYQFGDGTPEEVKGYLDDFEEQNISDLLIDLRNNGGGYLASVEGIAGYFLEENSVVLKEEYKSGKTIEIRTKQEPYHNFNNIVILVNGNTASASEVLTMALKEHLDHVTVVGTTTYGKGTVQVSRAFADGSVIKFTAARWLSPNDNWVNGVGITPDIEVEQEEIKEHEFGMMEDGETFTVDQVSPAVADVQLCLDYLGYDVDRTDGYFSQATQDAVMAYQNDHQDEPTGVINFATYVKIYIQMTVDSKTNERDTQMDAALEVFHG